MAGQVGRPHGLGGEVYVFPISDDPRRFAPGSKLEHERLGELTVEASRRHRNRLLVKFVGVDGRGAAESLRGALYVSAAMLRELGRGEFWEHELVGATVVEASTGGVLGTVSGLVRGPAQDLLEVRTPGGERLVPLVADIVVEVDAAGRRIRVDPPAGLLDG